MPTSDLSHILNSRKQLIAQHFSQAKDYEQAATVQRITCEQLIDLINKHNRNKLLEVGAGSGQLTKLLANHVSSEKWVINELAKSASRKLHDLSTNFKSAKSKSTNIEILIGDAETTNLGYGYDLIISANAIQWFDNPLSFIPQSMQRLNRGGQLLFNTFTPNNFQQIKQLTGRGLHYPTIDAWQQALNDAGVAVQCFETYRYDLNFDTPYDVLRHVKATGVSTNTINERPFIWTKSRLDDFTQKYWQRFGCSSDSNNNSCATLSKDKQSDGVILTYETLVISALKR